MGWEIGFDEQWKRDIGYGVPSICDHPDCSEKIDRGLSYVCGGDAYGGARGCGLYFCYKHLLIHARLPQLCARCSARRSAFTPKPDLPEWTEFKETDPSWAEWRRARDAGELEE
jgi:hypothetical protein